MERSPNIYWHMIQSYTPRFTVENITAAFYEMGSEVGILENTDGVAGPGEVVLFINPGKFPEIAEFLYSVKPMGVLVKCLVHPDFLPDSEHLNGIRWW